MAKQMKHIDIKSMMDAHPLFQTLPEDARGELLDRSAIMTFSAGELLIDENKVNETLYLLAEGAASVVMNETPVSTLQARDIAGEISTSGLSPPIASVIAETDLIAIAFPIKVVSEIAARHDVFARKMREIGMKRVSE